jgi:hypothetical protein
MMSPKPSAGENARTDEEAPPTEKHDGPTLGRGELHVPADDAVILTDGGEVEADEPTESVAADLRAFAAELKSGATRGAERTEPEAK